MNFGRGTNGALSQGNGGTPTHGNGGPPTQAKRGRRRQGNGRAPDLLSSYIGEQYQKKFDRLSEQGKTEVIQAFIGKVQELHGKDKKTVKKSDSPIPESPAPVTDDDYVRRPFIDQIKTEVTWDPVEPQPTDMDHTHVESLMPIIEAIKTEDS